MNKWLVDIIQQIALGEYLAASNLDCGTRFGLIAVDNAVEYMLVCYFEIHKRLVGGHVTGGISNKDWQFIRAHFDNLFDEAAEEEVSLARHETDVKGYHNTRNSLYHAGIPTTVSPKLVRQAASTARDILQILFSETITKEEWEQYLIEIGQTLNAEKAKPELKHVVSFDEQIEAVRFVTEAQPSAQEAIALVLYGFGVTSASIPTRVQLIRSLHLSGHPLAGTVVNTRLGELRRKKYVQSNRNVLTPTGTTNLRKKYILR